VNPSRRDKNFAVPKDTRSPSSGSSKATGPSKFSGAGDGNSIGEIIGLVKTYARQETIGPLKGAGRWLAFGTAGALALGFGLSMLLLGLLRLLQNEAPGVFDGNWSWGPYGITLVACVIVMLWALMRVRKDTLQRKEPRR
jgi:hypothetical protein